MSEDNHRVALMASQRSDVGSILRAHGFTPAEFEWITDNPPSSGVVPLTLKHKKASYHFTFDRFFENGSLRDWYCIYTPGREEETATQICGSWATVCKELQGWVGFMQRELEAEDPWAEEAEEFVEDFGATDENFTEEELKELDKRLGEVEAYLIENVDPKNKQAIAEIHEGVRKLTELARGSTKREWAMAFFIWITQKSVEWALTSDHWHTAVRIVVKGAKFLLLGG